MRCCICGSEESRFLCHWDQSFKLYRCNECGLVFTHPTPDDEILSKFYTNLPESREFISNYKQCLPIVVNSAKGYLTLAKKLMDLEGTTKLLDVAGGSGLYTKAFETLECDSYYIDIDTESTKFASETLKLENVINGNIENLSDYYDIKFDIIFAKQIIEHATNPVSLIKNIHDLLKPGGLLIIDTPNNIEFERFCHPHIFMSYLKRLMNNNPNFSIFHSFKKIIFDSWLYADPPRHLYAFNEKNLSYLLNNHGLKPVKTITSVWGDSIYNPLPYVLRKPSKLYYSYERMSSEIIKKFNRGGQLCIFAQRSK